MDPGNVLVIKLTGKTFRDKDIIRRHVDTYRELVEQGYKLAIITGGGGLAREYIGIAKALGLSSNYWLDMIGIMSSRLNAYLIQTLLRPYSYPDVPSTNRETILYSDQYKVVVLGGLLPGQSTAAVAVEIAEALNARKVIDYSVVGMVYDKDPSKYPDAKPIRKIKASELIQLLEQRSEPGHYEFFDKKALLLAIRSRITIYITSYTKPETVWDIIKGGNPGTIIYPY